MIDIVGVRFRDCGQIHFFKSGTYTLKRGDLCWAETRRGSVLGKVVMATTRAHDRLVPDSMPKIIGMAESDEKPGLDEDAQQEKEAFNICQKLIVKHELGMKLVRCSFLNGGKKIIFFFTADGRVDFRALLKDLAREFRIRIELRQIGVRDESKILGGIGSCGYTLCCATWIQEFRPVSIKMAKKQNLSLDPQKISGLCGRLKCCLSYEVDSSSHQHRYNNENGKRSVHDCLSGSCPRPYDPPL